MRLNSASVECRFISPPLPDLEEICSNLLNLRRLNVAESRVSDKAMNFLWSLNFLESLNLHRTAISDVAIDDLCRLTTLKEIDVSSTNLSSSGREKISLAIPGLKHIN